MKDFFSPKSRRILKISEQLVLNDSIISFEEISLLNDCSIRTVYDDVSALLDMSKIGIEIDNIHNTVTSKSSSIADLMVLKSVLLREQLNTKILFLLYFEKENYDIYDLAIKFNYSESHIRSKIQDLNIYLRKYSTEIVYSDRYKIITNQPILFSSLIYALIKATMLYELIPEEKEVDNLFMSFTLKHNFHLPEILECDLSNVFQVYALNNTDLDAYLYLILDTNENFSSVDFNNMIKKSLNKSSVQFTDETLTLIVEILRALSFKIGITPFLIDDYMNRYEYFYYNFEAENKAASNILKQEIEIISKKSKIDFTVFECELIFQIYTELVHLRDYKRSSVGVYSDISNKHAQSLITTLEKHFSQHDFFIFNQNSQYDFIISTSTFPHFLRKYEDKLIAVSDFITLKDMRSIYRMLYL